MREVLKPVIHNPQVLNELRYSNPPPAEQYNLEEVADTHAICQRYQSIFEETNPTLAMKLECMAAEKAEVKVAEKPVIRKAKVFNELNYSISPPNLDVSHWI